MPCFLGTLHTRLSSLQLSLLLCTLREVYLKYKSLHMFKSRGLHTVKDLLAGPGQQRRVANNTVCSELLELVRDDVGVRGMVYQRYIQNTSITCRKQAASHRHQ